MIEIRDAEVPADIGDVERLWLEYLHWGNEELASRHGFQLPVDEAVQRDLETIDKYRPPEGRLLLAVAGGFAIGTAAMRRVGPGTAEIKRMWVDPSRRRGGIGRGMLDLLIEAASAGGYSRVVLDSPDFMTAAHGLYRSTGFVDRDPYPESEIPREYRSHWIFMERRLEA